MGNQQPVRAVLLPAGTTVPANQGAMQLVLVDSSGNALTAPKKMPAQADSTAVDVATLKTDFNSLLAKLRTAGALS